MLNLSISREFNPFFHPPPSPFNYSFVSNYPLSTAKFNTYVQSSVILYFVSSFEPAGQVINIWAFLLRGNGHGIFLAQRLGTEKGVVSGRTGRFRSELYSWIY